MRRMTITIGTAMVAMLTATLLAQAPNFAGKWTRDAVKTAAAAAAAGRTGGAGGGNMTITQDARQLVITRLVQEMEEKAIYNLDGSVSRNKLLVGGGWAEVTSTATWDGATLALSTAQATGTQLIVFALEGDWLVQTTTNPGRVGGPGTPRVVYFKRVQ